MFFFFILINFNNLIHNKANYNNFSEKKYKNINYKVHKKWKEFNINNKVIYYSRSGNSFAIEQKNSILTKKDFIEKLQNNLKNKYKNNFTNKNILINNLTFSLIEREIFKAHNIFHQIFLVNNNEDINTIFSLSLVKNDLNKESIKNIELFISSIMLEDKKAILNNIKNNNYSLKIPKYWKKINSSFTYKGLSLSISKHDNYNLNEFIKNYNNKLKEDYNGTINCNKEYCNFNFLSKKIRFNILFIIRKNQKNIFILSIGGRTKDIKNNEKMIKNILNSFYLIN